MPSFPARIKFLTPFLFRMQKTNRFALYADADEEKPVQAQAAAKAKAAEPKKKVIVKVAKAAEVAEEEGNEFARVDARPQTAGAARGGRGGRGGERGGRGGRGGDRPRGDRRGGRGGERGGNRDRPRTAKVEGDEGADVERAERGGERKRFEGKPREGAHPMDRRDGTGRGRRGDRKEGEGKGAWGNDRKPREEGAEGEEPKESTEPKEQKEPRERKPREAREPRERREPREPKEEVKAEPVVEEEEIGFTLDDFMAKKAAKSTGLIKKADVRKNEKIDAKNISEFENTNAAQFQTTFDTVLVNKDTHVKARGEGAELLGFGSVNYDDDFQVRRGGNDRGARPQAQRPQNKGGRKGGKLVVDDNDFPAL